MATGLQGTKVAVCTIVAHNYVPRASVLARSVELFHPEFEMFTVIIDHPHLAKDVSIVNSNIISIDDVDMKHNAMSQQVSIYDITEFATSIKPYVIEQLLNQYEVVIYLDPDTQLFSRIDSLVENTLVHGWSITPHVNGSYVNRNFGPSEKEIMGAGIYNLGYIGVSRQSIPMLLWWQHHLDRDAIVDQERQLFTDQRWIDLAATIFKPYVESGSQYNVAYWNLDHRLLARNSDGEYTVDGEKLAFFHFSGFNPDVPHLICGYQDEIPRVSMSDNPLYYEIFDQYRLKVKESESVYGDLPPYGWADCAPGVALGRHVRRLIRLELMAAENGLCPFPPSPFDPDQVDEFFKWLRESSPIDHRPIPRHALAKLISLPHDNARLKDMHLQSVITDYEHWFNTSLLPTEPLSRLIGNRIALHHVDQPFFSTSHSVTTGVDVVGYVHSELGVGESARRVADALKVADVSVNVCALAAPGKPQTKGSNNPQELSHSVLLLAVNADQVAYLAPHVSAFRKKVKTIGQWYWELERPPTWMVDSFKFLDEVWVATEFMAQSVKSVAPKHFPVRVMPIPLKVAKYEPVSREDLDLDSRFTFGFVFDFLSVMKRKNPIGLINAYIAAFPSEGKTRLVIKTINSHLRPKEREELLWLSRTRSDITIVNETWDQVEVLSFLKHIDCYVSMHRSEGLGLTMAEAMSQGTPVIATAYSGNLDFMTTDNSYLIPYELVKVGNCADNYDPDAEWAEPNLDVAIQLLQRVVVESSEALEIGRRGMNEVNTRFSYPQVGSLMRKHLQEIGSI